MLYTAGIIGTGRIGFSLGFDKKREQPASHSFALAGNKHIKITAGCDTDKSRLEKWGRFFPGAKTFPDTDSFFSSSDIPDITVVAVNESSHLPVALQALASKTRLIILEKPVALNVKEGCALKTAADKSGAAILVNHERRFASDYRLAKKLIDNGEIGDIQTVRAVLCSGLAVYSPDAEETGAYSLLHDGTHLIDIVHFLLDGFFAGDEHRLKNPAVSVFRSETKQENENTGVSVSGGIEVSNVSAFYQMDCGIQVTLEISGRSRFFDFYLDITGTTGRIKIGNGFAAQYARRESKLYSGFYSLAENKSVRFPGKTGYFSNMVKNAVDFLDGKEKIFSSLDDGLAALKTIEEIKSGIKEQTEK